MAWNLLVGAQRFHEVNVKTVKAKRKLTQGLRGGHRKIINTSLLLQMMDRTGRGGIAWPIVGSIAVLQWSELIGTADMYGGSGR